MGTAPLISNFSLSWIAGCKLTPAIQRQSHPHAPQADQSNICLTKNTIPCSASASKNVQRMVEHFADAKEVTEYAHLC